MGQIIDGAFYSDYDGQDIDRRLAIAGSVSNPNLLDNPWFTVNQRGATSGTAVAYIADRWLATYGSGGVTWSRTDDTITIQSTTGLDLAYLEQKMGEKLYNSLGGKTVTLSVMLGDYSIISGTTANFRLDTSFAIELDVDAQGNRTFCTFYNNTKLLSIAHEKTPITIRAVKLELGSVSTLANDVAPNYDLELQKCRGHVLVVGGDSTVVLTGWMEGTTFMRGSTLTDLNFTPTTISMAGSFYVYAGGSFAGVSSVALQNSNKHNIDVTTSTALQNNTVAIMRGVNSDSKIVISDGLG